jgi:aspartate aminotransferase
MTHVGAWAPKPEQEATAKYFQNADNVNTFIDDFKGKLEASLKVLHSGIQDLKGKGLAVESIEPMGALYLTIKLDYIGKIKPDETVIENSSDLVFYLINEAGVALVPFSAFGEAKSEPWFRASVGGLDIKEIELMMPKLENALNNLK